MSSRYIRMSDLPVRFRAFPNEKHQHFNLCIFTIYFNTLFTPTIMQ